MSCRDRLGLLLAWEVDDPELRAEHFLIVASYNLQHPAQLTDEAFAGLCAAFVDYLDHRAGVDEILRRFRQSFDGKARVLRPAEKRLPAPRARARVWDMTIADACIPDQSDAAARVRSWATSIRNNL